MMDDFYPGDPANIVIGKPDEKPARKHAPQPPKPPVRSVPNADAIHRMIKDRMGALAPLVREYERLCEADSLITKAVGPLR